MGGGGAPARRVGSVVRRRQLLVAPSYDRCRALLAAGRGLPDEVESLAAQALAGAEASGHAGSCSRPRGRAGSRRCWPTTPSKAAESLRAVWEHMQREGVDDPGAFPVAPDLVEALVESASTTRRRRSSSG